MVNKKIVLQKPGCLPDVLLYIGDKFGELRQDVLPQGSVCAMKDTKENRKDLKGMKRGRREMERSRARLKQVYGIDRLDLPLFGP